MFQEDDEIRKLREEWPNLSHEDKVDKFLWKMVWLHHQKHIPGNPNMAINNLSDVIKKATDSSETLTSSIKRATWVGGIAAAGGVIVAIIGIWNR